MIGAPLGRPIVTLPFRGQRDYVQGADILNTLLGHTGQADLGLIFSVHEMIHSDQLRLHEVASLAELGACPVRLQLSDGRLVAADPVAKSSDPERLPDHEVDIWDQSQLVGDTNAIQGFLPLDPLAIAVSLKKQMMIHRLGSEFGKWTFCKLTLDRPLPRVAKRIVVCYLRGARNIHMSTILFDDVEHGQMTFMARQ
jgi:hypothetical protein